MKFVADDGKIFDDITSCQEYETECKLKEIEEKKKKTYEAELANTKTFTVSFTDESRPDTTLIIHSLSDHKLFAVMIAVSLFGNNLCFKDNKIISENITTVYKITTNKVPNVDTYLNSENSFVFEANDVPQIFTNVKNQLVFTPGGFAKVKTLAETAEMDKQIESARTSANDSTPDNTNTDDMNIDSDNTDETETHSDEINTIADILSQIFGVTVVPIKDKE